MRVIKSDHNEPTEAISHFHGSVFGYPDVIGAIHLVLANKNELLCPNVIGELALSRYLAFFFLLH